MTRIEEMSVRLGIRFWPYRKGTHAQWLLLLFQEQNRGRQFRIGASSQHPHELLEEIEAVLRAGAGGSNENLRPSHSNLPIDYVVQD